MTDPETILRIALLNIAARLDIWATDSVTGGWSTRHVKPQRDLAHKIRDAVATKRYSNLVEELAQG